MDLSPTKITRRGLPINNGIPLILVLAEHFLQLCFVLVGSSPQGKELVFTCGLINT